jgi:predicted transcriptional regulator
MPRKSLADLRDEMRAVARGERMPSPRPAASVLTALTAETLELLNVIATHPATTVSGLAQHLGKAQSNVSRSLQRLAGHGLVRLVREGREVRPQLVSTEIKVDLINKTVQAVEPRRAIGAVRDGNGR